MVTKKRTGKKVWIIIIIVSIYCQILFDPLSSLEQWGESIQVRIKLPDARRKWDSQGITHYKFHIKGTFPMECLFGGDVEVKDGEVVHTGLSRDLDLGFLNFFGSVEDHPFCDYRNYTMPRIFDLFCDSAAGISFDPNYGFISSYEFSCRGRGLLSPRISDCSGGFTIEDFQVLGE